ncbi:hypothetical protein J3E72DRAFT_417635 [Bipolaris maydis]|uniref:uncharacterized protein n=1 Tax=Cochliobolus heterostrophus TaxID=5016 RepID=UPI0024D9A702|nr:hypothetical protein J3E74DRAFT_451474 [Bipolaris maydis]KAJ6198348.1 hypothetical protein J3E72DRAFT_417635 [Bipolaris maydis]KAJ6271986.1 hypothetical protein PSV08DRAFT_388180 [Bipolaris maydis]
MTTSSDELVGKLSAMTIVGDEDQERVDVNARRAIGCNNTPEEDCQNSIQPTNVVSSDAQTETESKRIDFLIDTLGTNEFSINKPAIRCLLIHFERDIRDIIRRFIHEPSTGDFIWKTMEECYNEAVSPSGTLNAHGFFDYLKDSPCIRSMDSDFESQDHAGNFKGERSWADFWVTVLDCSHGGPTLFCPRNSSDTNLGSSDDIPRYLFRVFDEKSSGINSEQIFESSGRNRYNTEKGPNADLVSLPHSTATDLIFYHLKSKNGEKDMDDNLVSWTSSLLFAIQYAVCIRYLRTRGNNIKICMVDTHKFPQGQLYETSS